MSKQEEMKKALNELDELCNKASDPFIKREISLRAFTDWLAALSKFEQDFKQKPVYDMFENRHYVKES